MRIWKITRKGSWISEKLRSNLWGNIPDFKLMTPDQMGFLAYAVHLAESGWNNIHRNLSTSLYANLCDFSKTIVSMISIYHYENNRELKRFLEIGWRKNELVNWTRFEYSLKQAGHLLPKNEETLWQNTFLGRKVRNSCNKHFFLHALWTKSIRRAPRLAVWAAAQDRRGQRYAIHLVHGKSQKDLQSRPRASECKIKEPQQVSQQMVKK